MTLAPGDTYTVYVDGSDLFVAADGTRTSNDAPTSSSEESSTDAETLDDLFTLDTPSQDGVLSSIQCQGYDDLSSSSEFCAYVSALASAGVLSIRTSFEPERSMSRAELLKIVMRAKGFSEDRMVYVSEYSYADISPNDWWAPYVSTA
ncbi:MAG TPA: S-layer homology domain-containing protein, partial [bacterium]|nr:S-layer homology domain-containing protein [bacterium]